MTYSVALRMPEDTGKFQSPMLPTIRPQRGTGRGSQYSKAEQKRIVEHLLVHAIRAEELAEHFNMSLASVYNWKRDYLMGMYADEVIYNHTIAFRRS